ncbi:MAG TPA: SDR family NAD(P)-dependent oxidoreductase [Pyrinomonadaceae bacterium]|jgi:NAD(P)-dependent dehydrogenase (short-subunit alcohol dehydrogenase family)|nr:SDR family NAD(P)-dependent oxidoreductase [Pyrinomonadaceae bacterium]
MKEFRGKVAVVTGAASGIGRGLAERCAQERMRVVLADVDEAALAQAARELKDSGADVLAVRTDVSRADDVDALARRTLDAFGAAHLLFNNAGVGAGTTVWESTLEDWRWVLGVNLWGVIHGVRAFVPVMLEQADECHIVNTASMAGLVSGPALGVYKVTKHGVVSLSETLCCELAVIGSKIGVSVLCPAGVNTRVMDSERNRPAELQNAPAEGSAHPVVAQAEEMLRRLVAAGMPPSEVAGAVFGAIRDGRFYILTHADWKPLVQKRMDDILQDRNPC